MSLNWNRFAPWAAPALLVIIALAQLGFSQLSSLSPWKGGGFGMFSTVDSPAARFLRVYLVTDRGEIAVLVPDRLRETAREARTTGARAATGKLAQSVADGTWVKLRITSAVQRYRQLSQTDALARPTDPPADAPLGLQGLDLVRMLEPNESLAPNDVAVAAKGVRVEVWKYTFDRAGMSLNAAMLLEVAAPIGPVAKAAL